MRDAVGEVGEFGVRGEVVEDWEGGERVAGVLVEVVVREDGVGETILAVEGPGTFGTELCSCSGAVVDPSATTEDFASFVDSTTGVADVVLGTPSAVDVVYPGSYVPLISGQSMLKDAARKAAHSFRRTAVAPSSQSSVYIVTSSHHEISTALIAKGGRYRYSYQSIHCQETPHWR